MLRQAVIWTTASSQDVLHIPPLRPPRREPSLGRRTAAAMGRRLAGGQGTTDGCPSAVQTSHAPEQIAREQHRVGDQQRFKEIALDDADIHHVEPDKQSERTEMMKTGFVGGDSQYTRLAM